jgi:AcrR family transcriptional regulator
MAATLVSSQHPMPAADTRFDRRLSEILDFATEVFAEKGYEGASIRDLSRLSGTSLAGLYYYFDSKEKLLYSIQKHTFSTIIDRLRKRLSQESDPEQRLRIFVHNHVEYALGSHKAMKVLSHEDDVLKNGYRSELAAIKRSYYRICIGLVEDLTHNDRRGAMKPRRADIRTAVMSLFGAMNWLYTWHNPKSDPDAVTLAKQISDLFLQGIPGIAIVGRDRRADASVTQKAARRRREPLSRCTHE